MELKANVNFDRFEGQLQVVDAHTEGEFCRIVYGGFPEPEGNTMIEKKKWMEKNYDDVRTALMFEPRGHHDMFGAFLCKPVNPEASFGVMFMDTGGYLNMCGHCTIGAVTVAIEAGFVESHEGENEVVLEAPAGLIRTTAVVKDGKVEPDSITEDTIESYLDTAGVPDPDLLIRTSGEERLSNYLLWQLAYSEFYFTDVIWPDFSKEELWKAIEQYNARDRRYGKV